MIPRFVARTLVRSPRRLLVGVVGIAIPVALFAGTAFFVDTATRSMTSRTIASEPEGKPEQPEKSSLRSVDDTRIEWRSPRSKYRTPVPSCEHRSGFSP